MTNQSLHPTVICYGEILWDNLPTGRMAGGAPMNVAYHLSRVGAKSELISRVGNDAAGEALIEFCSSIGLPTKLIQTDISHATGEVNATVMDNKDVVYEILPDAAWDFIHSEPTDKALVSQAEAFVFGSLSARSEKSRTSLLELLDSPVFKVLDINLRAPHYSNEILKLLIKKADFLKLNNDELVLLSEWFYKKGASEQDAISFLQDHFSVKEILVTKASSGASYYKGAASYSGKAYSVEVADTVGAGDSFLAAFLYKKLTGATVEETMSYALAMGAFIAGKKGACPIYTLDELEIFRKNAGRQH